MPGLQDADIVLPAVSAGNGLHSDTQVGGHRAFKERLSVCSNVCNLQWEDIGIVVLRGDSDL
jgi:hypothetical protein